MFNRFNLNVTKIYNPISIKKNLKHKKLNIKNNFFEKNTLNILHIGRLVKEKNQSEIINAFSNIKNKERLRLLIIGIGPEKKNLENLIKVKKLNKLVKISNNQKNKSFYLNKSNIFVLSSLYEGLPNVLLEAAVNRKYIISSNCPTGPKEIINNYKYGETYKVKSVKQLTSVLEKFSNNPDLLKKLKKN